MNKFTNNKFLFFILVTFETANIVGSLQCDHFQALNTKCFEDLGCFKSDGFLDTLSTLPIVFSNPNTMNVTFNLFTRQNRDVPQVFNYRSNDSEITNSFFRSKHKTKIIVHGYREEFPDWMKQMKDYLLNYSDYNVFALDWSKPASNVNYVQSAADTEIVGAMIAYFIIRTVMASPNQFHCIGHSLGAHVCGFAGQRLQNPKLSEISGLDPAGPAFPRNDPDTRLDSSDAQLVVIINTNAQIFPLMKNFENAGKCHQIFHDFTTFGRTLASSPIALPAYLGNGNNLGHFNFWPNGGQIQPGCSLKFANENSPESLLDDPYLCNHRRSYEYPKSSSNGNCQYIGYECQSYSDFEEGKCADCGTDNNKCKPMEFDLQFWDNFNRSQLSSQQKNYYLKTDESNPFCLFHYQILVQIANGSKQTRGKLEILLSHNTKITFPESGSNFNHLAKELFKFGQNNTQLYLDKNELELMDCIQVKYSSLLKNRLKIEMISVNYMSHIDKSVRQQKSIDFCPVSDTYISVGEFVAFKQC